MGHVFVNVRFRGRDVFIMEKVLVNPGASFTVMPLEIAREHFIETPFEAEVKLGDGRMVKAKVFIAEAEIEGRRGPVQVLAFSGAMPVVGVDTLES
ncbi:aspartyl protease family protein [Caldivirga sp.]|jgi:predicted aspartyl protease|uniref:aspartyl protease family protein n=1 Tax=Caldivirga sp. TaxID=2080243 RepID=UPI003D0BDBBD